MSLSEVNATGFLFQIFVNGDMVTEGPGQGLLSGDWGAKAGIGTSLPAYFRRRCGQARFPINSLVVKMKMRCE